nr:hypothetical protein [Tanacetum cinerariifolium]
KLLKDLKELAEYDQSIKKKPEATTDTELSSTKDIHPLAVQESPHDSDICQLIRDECSIEVPEQQKQKMEDTIELAHIKPKIPKSDFDFEEEIRLIENLPYDNSFLRLPKELNAEIADTIIESIPLLPIPEEIDIVTETDDVMPLSVENDDDDYDLLLEEVDLFLSDNLIPPGIENVADDPEGDIRFLEELLINNSILSHESSDSNFEDNPSIS